jgi:hypothetical protein
MLYQLSKTWQTRPSSLVDIEDTYVAYCLDQAVATWGGFVETELGKVEGKNSQDIESKQRAILTRLLGGDEEESARGRFRDPAEFFS